MPDRTKKILNVINDYGQGLFNFIRGKVSTEADAEDILQDVWYQLSNVDDVDEIGQMRGWLFKVARNKIVDKSRKKIEELIDNLVYGQDDDGDEQINFAEILMPDNNDPESVYIKEVFWQELFTALDELPEAQRNVFVWNELQDKIQQIAGETGEKLKTIISRKGYAVKYLRSRLQALYNDFFDY